MIVCDVLIDLANFYKRSSIRCAKWRHFLSDLNHTPESRDVTRASR